MHLEFNHIGIKSRKGRSNGLSGEATGLSASPSAGVFVAGLRRLSYLSESGNRIGRWLTSFGKARKQPKEAHQKVWNKSKPAKEQNFRYFYKTKRSEWPRERAKITMEMTSLVNPQWICLFPSRVQPQLKSLCTLHSRERGRAKLLLLGSPFDLSQYSETYYSGFPKWRAAFIQPVVL